MVEPTTTGEKFKRKVAIPVANLVFHLNVCICEIYIAHWILKILNSDFCFVIFRVFLLFNLDYTGKTVLKIQQLF